MNEETELDDILAWLDNDAELLEQAGDERSLTRKEKLARLRALIAAI